MSQPFSQPVSAVLLAGASRHTRAVLARHRIQAAAASTSGLEVVEVTDGASRSFSRHVASGLSASGALLVWLRDVHDAWPAGQQGSTRLVLTQSAYQLQRWFDWAEARGGVTLIADADPGLLSAAAPEALARRGPWSRVTIETVGSDRSQNPQGVQGVQGGSSGPNRLPDLSDLPVKQAPLERSMLMRAFVTSDPGERLALCRRAAEAAPDDPVTQLALGSAYMEVQDLEASKAAIEAALRLAPDWEAPHFEYGKLWLRFDDMKRASVAFADAGRIMPTFSTAFSNLGATLGELDRPEEALKAFEQALTVDPNGYTILNNLGVVSRELGRLSESEAAFRRVISLAPEFVFGHYNLGHALFLQGRYQAALAAYEEGQRRDPDKNARQACRLAVVRLAAGDPDGALRDLQRYSMRVPADLRREVLGESQEILWALLTDQPALAGWRHVADFVKQELAKT